jgi:hypothetical protein
MLIGILTPMLRVKWRSWVVPWGLLAGLLLTLAFLGNMNFIALQGCRQTVFGPLLSHSLAGCFTLEEGYPVRFLSTYPSVEQDSGRSSDIASVSIVGVPVINTGALFEDWLIWSAVSCSVLYAASLTRERSAHRSGASAGEQPPTPEDPDHNA